MNKRLTAVKTNRLVSLDALRGFNMFWIIGARKIAEAFQQLNFPGASILVAQLNHTLWNGFTFYDLIFPMFVFVVGISTAFSISRRLEKGEDRWLMVRHILARGGWMILLGILVSNAGFRWSDGLAGIRWMGVLQRIAICYCVSALLMIFTKPRFQAVVAGALLVGYWLLLGFVPVPGHGSVILNGPGMNIVNYMDSRFLPGRLFYGTYDPEGLLSTIPAIATCLLGVFTGYWLRREGKWRGKPITKAQKAGLLVVFGLVAVGLGLLWNMNFPINKKIWTSSFVLLTGGLSAICMAAFYWLIDIRGKRKWAFPFVVIGVNSIFIYLAAELIPFGTITNWLMGQKLLTWFGSAQALSLAALTLIIEWSILYTLYRRRLFLKI